MHQVQQPPPRIDHRSARQTSCSSCSDIACLNAFIDQTVYDLSRVCTTPFIGNGAGFQPQRL
jgi:hypothetical protein